MFEALEVSVEQADRALQEVIAFKPRTARGLWDKEQYLRTAESISVIAHQREIIAHGDEDAKKLELIVSC